MTVWYGAKLKKRASMRNVRNNRFLDFTATCGEIVRRRRRRRRREDEREMKMWMEGKGMEGRGREGKKERWITGERCGESNTAHTDRA